MGGAESRPGFRTPNEAEKEHIMAVILEPGLEVDVPHWIDIIENDNLEQYFAAVVAKTKGQNIMEDKESLKAEVKKLNARAMEARMALHDLSEELPVGLDTVMEVAQQTVVAFQSLEAARKKLAAASA
jgi:hypothetical protein